MKIIVQRSGGVAGMKRTWTVRPEPPDDTDRWQPLIEACPWDDVAVLGEATGQPDRFMYSIRADQRRAVLPERELTGPWRDLVESARAAAEEGGPAELG
ncbi:hypothetical protein SAMN04487914_14914 [Arthrobacter sp. ok909]|uniref:protealysin inhibitor emfourin n=1 Tax=Arthrobacter sp. ok909 TaxID=1761746 RepID=UPI000889C456|nr:protealysin inhibitor emfourin [Arthrobacter sp. ok909]SDP82864.1 hypothetical protein SAMN04487914_14914 [Arthrobacter sp. ok909]